MVVDRRPLPRSPRHDDGGVAAERIPVQQAARIRIEPRLPERVGQGHGAAAQQVFEVGLDAPRDGVNRARLDGAIETRHEFRTAGDHGARVSASRPTRQRRLQPGHTRPGPRAFGISARPSPLTRTVVCPRPVILRLMRNVRSLFVLASACLLGACSGSSAPPPAAPAPLVLGHRYVDLRPQRAGPQDDLFRYVNGGWLARTEIPADKASYGAFDMLFDKSQVDLRAVVEGAGEVADGAPGSERQKSATSTRASWTKPAPSSSA